MYQLLIIDDEPIVREGLKILLPWEEYGFHICGEGIDGRDGLNKILELMPDLVLVDIKMPGISGIELIKKAKESGYEGKFIILSGHSDFEFAKSAISFGVRAYLLKPIDEEELVENILNMVEELDAKKNLDAYYSKSELKAKKELLRRLLLYNVDKEILRKEFKQYGLGFHHKQYCVAILSPKKQNQIVDGVDYETEDDFEAELFVDVEKVYLEEKQVLIGTGYTCKNFQSALSLYNEKIKNIKGDSLFITVGHNVTYWEDIHFSYESAKLLSSYQFLFEEIGIININILEVGENKEEPVVELLGDLIEVGNITGIHTLLEKRKKYYRASLLTEAEVKVKIAQNMMKVYSKIEKHYEKQKEQIPDINVLFEMIKCSYTLDNVMEGIFVFCEKVSYIIGGTSASNVVKRMIAFMENNYSADLKLESIAKMFNYNSAYLGKLFKKNMGESFNNVLDSIRIYNAKKLLIETDLKVYQVSEQVGYSNIDYFYSKFKKYVGISPKEYKNK